MEYKIKIRTWNMNYWKKRKGSEAKTGAEEREWIKYAKESIIKNDSFDYFVLQETSFNMFSGETIEFHCIDDNSILANKIDNDIIKRIDYMINPKKYMYWGNMIISKCDLKNDIGYMVPKNGYNSELAYQCIVFLEKKYLVSLAIINVHLQKDYKTGMYYPSLKKLIDEIKTLKNKLMADIILLVGDFNASDKFPSAELDDFKKAFIEIKEMGFVDCTESIDLDKRSTMVDYEYQNDYVFINEPYFKNIKNVVIRKDIVSEYIDHYPIDFEIEIQDTVDHKTHGGIKYL
ncbi:hypothetical protein R84B8_02206 [Treponema sp. R8-4-B8]